MGRNTSDSMFTSINIPYEEMSKHSRRRDEPGRFIQDDSRITSRVNLFEYQIIIKAETVRDIEVVNCLY